MIEAAITRITTSLLKSIQWHDAVAPEKRLAGAFLIVFARTGPVAYCFQPKR